MEFELMFCDECFQMTNHIHGVCQKCLSKLPKLTFEERLYDAHHAVLNPEYLNKDNTYFLTMLIQRLLDKTDGMTDDQIEEFLGY